MLLAHLHVSNGSIVVEMEIALVRPGRVTGEGTVWRAGEDQDRIPSDTVQWRSEEVRGEGRIFYKSLRWNLFDNISQISPGVS